MNLWERLRDREFRKAFVEQQVRRGLSVQLRILRTDRGWSQEELAKRAEVKLSVVVAIEKGTGAVSFDSLLRIAKVFDVAIVGRFVPFSVMVKFAGDLAAIEVPEFSDEDPDNPGGAP